MKELPVLKLPGSEALAELNRLRNDYPKSGNYPILLGDVDEILDVTQGMEEDFDSKATIAASYEIDPLKWFPARFADNLDMLGAKVGDWPKTKAAQMEIVTHQDVLTQKPLPLVAIAQFKLTSPWEAFAHLNWGAVNECPGPEEHCALHRYWESLYGAEVVSITCDIVQCVVARPPKDRDASLRSAQEQYIYCCDIVDQGVLTIAALAAELLNARYWYFWWD